MGQATIDKEHTEIHKVLKFGVNQTSFGIQPFKNDKINKEMYGHADAVFGSVQMPYISL